MKNDDLSEAARDLLDGAKKAPGPGRARKARVTAALMATVGSSALATAGVGTTLKLIGAGLLAGVVGVSGTMLVIKELRRPHPEAVTVVQSRSPRVVPTAPSVPSLSPEPEREPTRTPSVQIASPPTPAEQPRVVRSPPARPLAPLPTPPTLDLARPSPNSSAPAKAGGPRGTADDEVTALGAALDAMEAERPAEALIIVRRAREHNPNGVLRPELALAEVLALCALSHVDEARAAAEGIPDVDKTPLVLERLRGSCVAP